MPRIKATAIVEVPIDVAFALSQTYGELRYRWDPFVREQHLLGDATGAAVGVRTHTLSRHRLTMVSEYVRVDAPRQVGMRMVSGPWFFRSFGAGWRFTALPDGRTEATWRYTFTCRPRVLAFVAEPLGRWILGRDIRRRLAAFARACADPSIVGEVRVHDDPPAPRGSGEA
jgi:hypothetical protein